MFSRTEMLIGQAGLSTLRRSTVAVFGLGGVGSYSTEALARSGVGNLILIDYDTVSISNINRQLHAMEDTVGMLKVDLMAERVKRINPSIKVKKIGSRYSSESRESFFGVRPHYVVDAIDDMEAKVDLIKYCLSEGIPLISSMGTGNKMDPSLFRVDDISRTSVCPMARSVRVRLRKEGIESGLQVVFSTEPPKKLKSDPIGDKKNVPASISFVPPVAGLIMAGVAVRGLLQGVYMG
ncbi:MAG: tRNA threonylcarbamoyladenosine dehydratase [Desulfocucumaceae bacterium]